MVHVFAALILMTSNAQANPVSDCVRKVMSGVREAFHWKSLPAFDEAYEQAVEGILSKNPGTLLSKEPAPKIWGGRASWRIQVLPDPAGSKLNRLAASLEKRHGDKLYFFPMRARDRAGFRGRAERNISVSQGEGTVGFGESHIIGHELGHLNMDYRRALGMSDTFQGSVKGIDGHPIATQVDGHPYESFIDFSELSTFPLQISQIFHLSRSKPGMLANLQTWAKSGAPVARAVSEATREAAKGLSDSAILFKFSSDSYLIPGEDIPRRVVSMEVPLRQYATIKLPLTSPEAIEASARYQELLSAGASAQELQPHLEVLRKFASSRFSAISEKSASAAELWTQIQLGVMRRIPREDLARLIRKLRDLTRPDGT